MNAPSKQNPGTAPGAPSATPGLGAELGQSLGLDQEQLHPALQFLVDNIKLVAAGVVALLVLVAAFSGFDAWQASKLRDAQNELATLSVTDAEDPAALAAFAGDAPDALRLSALFVLAEAAQADGDHALAAETWARIQAEGGQTLTHVAALGRAEALMAEGRAVEALTLLTQAQQNAGEGYNTLIVRAKARAAELAGDTSAAVAAYEELLTLPGTTDEAFVTHKLAQLKASTSPSS